MSVITSTLSGFGVNAEIAEVHHGPSVDRYALSLMPGTKTSQVEALSKEIALALGAKDVRIVAPIPGTKYVGVEVPAEERRTVDLHRLASSMPGGHPLRFPVGESVDGQGVMARLDRCPHVLVAGTTGSGKSVWLTSVLAHIVMHAEPDEVEMILIDPKRVELAPFRGIRHLRMPVVTDMMRAIDALDEAVKEMDARYEMMEERGARSIDDLLDDAPPHLIIAIEEMADLMMTAGKRAEAAIVRLLQVGRAAGIHLILATQRPGADVITPLIKANTPTRMVFAVQSHHDSKVALGLTGAETLLGRGDGLWFPSGESVPERIQAPYLSTEDLTELLDEYKDGPAAPEPAQEADNTVSTAPTPAEPPTTTAVEPAAVVEPGTRLYTSEEVGELMQQAYESARTTLDDIYGRPKRPLKVHEPQAAILPGVPMVLRFFMVLTIASLALPILPLYVAWRATTKG